jgi:hypothetical protein
MATNVSIDGLMDAMVEQLTTNITTARSVQRYMGAEFDTKEGFERGVAGRTPALRVRHAGTKSLRATIGRRTERVESTFSIVVCSDSRRGKDDRSSLLVVAESVRNFIGSRAFSLMVTPAHFRSMDTLRDDDMMLAYAVTFTVRHRVDYCIDPGTDTIAEVTGDITNADETDTKPLTVGLHEVYTP